MLRIETNQFRSFHWRPRVCKHILLHMVICSTCRLKRTKLCGPRQRGASRSWQGEWNCCWRRYKNSAVNKVLFLFFNNSVWHSQPIILQVPKQLLGEGWGWSSAQYKGSAKNVELFMTFAIKGAGGSRLPSLASNRQWTQWIIRLKTQKKFTGSKIGAIFRQITSQVTTKKWKSGNEGILS